MHTLSRRRAHLGTLPVAESGWSPGLRLMDWLGAHAGALKGLGESLPVAEGAAGQASPSCRQRLKEPLPWLVVEDSSAPSLLGRAMLECTFGLTVCVPNHSFTCHGEVTTILGKKTAAGRPYLQPAEAQIGHHLKQGLATDS